MFIKNHPEKQSDELWLCNIGDTPLNTIWKTVRYGSIAYDNAGNIVKNYVPVFVKKQEIEEAGKLDWFLYAEIPVAVLRDTLDKIMKEITFLLKSDIDKELVKITIKKHLEWMAADGLETPKL